MADAGAVPIFSDAMFGPGRAVFVERSVKFLPGRRMADRILYGVQRDDAPGLRNRVLDLAARIGLPGAMVDEIDLRLADAHMVHAGQEGTGPGAVFKLYLEFAHPPPDLSGLRFLAWKAATDAAPVRSSYRLVPLATLLDGHRALEHVPLTPALRDAAGRILDLAGARCGVSDLTFLSVGEPGTDRVSFDLNVYDADLTVADAAPMLDLALRDLGHLAEETGFAPSDRLGHISAGLGRTGTPFWTIYAGASLRRAAA